MTPETTAAPKQGNHPSQHPKSLSDPLSGSSGGSTDQQHLDSDGLFENIDINIAIVAGIKQLGDMDKERVERLLGALETP